MLQASASFPSYHLLCHTILPPYSLTTMLQYSTLFRADSLTVIMPSYPLRRAAGATSAMNVAGQGALGAAGAAA